MWRDSAPFLTFQMKEGPEVQGQQTLLEAPENDTAQWHIDCIPVRPASDFWPTEL